MSKGIDEILIPRSQARLRIYAWTPNDPPADYVGLIKVGQTTQSDVNARIKQSQGQMQQGYTLHLDVPAEREDGTIFRDGEVRERLVAKGFENVIVGSSREWMRCSPDDVKAAVVELQQGLEFTGTRHETFTMRREQAEAVEKTAAYFQSVWEEDRDVVPRFLWNAKMRFGKTFAAYQLAKRLGARRVLVLTFKPAVADAWQTDLESHVDFDGWRFTSRDTDTTPSEADKEGPFVYFGSFQDLLGRDAAGNIKPKNTWIHTINWDLVIFDEYHFGAWRETAKELFEGEDETVAKKEAKLEYASDLAQINENIGELSAQETEILPIATRAYLYLSGTPFRALASGEFIEEQIFNWTYTDEQRAKDDHTREHPGQWNPYAALPQMCLMTYQMPDELLAIASQGEFDEFDLNAFFAATGTGSEAEFKHKSDVQKWLDIIRGSYAPTQVDNLKLGSQRPPFPYSDVRLLEYLRHSFWYLPSVASCHAMAKLLAEPHNTFWHDYEVLPVAGQSAGVGRDALPPVRSKIGNGDDTKTITLSCGKLTTGVTVPQWMSIFMLCNLKAPETYFQAAFRVQSPWSIRNPEGDDPDEELIKKPACYVFDFAPTRALRQLSDYAIGLAPDEADPEKAVEDLVSFLPVLAYNGSVMVQVDAGGILDIAMSGTSATLLARKWESALLVNVDNDTLRRILDNEDALDAVMRIEGFRALGADVLETIVNKSDAVKKTRKEKGDDLTDKEKRELTAEEKEYKAMRKQIQEKLIKFATRIPAFMYLTDFRENKLKDVITKLEPDLFRAVTGLTVEDFQLLVGLRVFNTEQMNQAVFAFRRYEDASLSYAGIDSHPGLTHYGLYDTVIARDADEASGGDQ
jgi:hypothetical protein